MITLSIQDIEDDVYQSLKVLARQHGLSLEQHIQNMLTNAVKKQDIKLVRFALECFSSSGVNELELPERTPYQPVELFTEIEDIDAHIAKLKNGIFEHQDMADLKALAKTRHEETVSFDEYLVSIGKL